MKRIKIGNFGFKPVKINGFSMLAHACSCVLTCFFCHHIWSHNVRWACGGSKKGILALNLLRSAVLTYLLMHTHACSCMLMLAHVCSHTLFCHHMRSHDVRQSIGGSKYGILASNLLKSAVLAWSLKKVSLPPLKSADLTWKFFYPNLGPLRGGEYSRLMHHQCQLPRGP